MHLLVIFISNQKNVFIDYITFIELFMYYLRYIFICRIISIRIDMLSML